ncbi:MAG: serine/threonine protein kinase [Deltaproteobacteria bacterium]|nr:serine/threonine protein kinase [Deltaproteobacteria bacterium]
MLVPGTQIGRYRLVKLLGQGGMGAVYEAVHIDLEKRVAIKTLHLHTSATDRERFLREGRAAAMLRHPHIATVFDSGDEQGTMYLVMELLEGESLEKLLLRESRLGAERTADLILPVLAAVGTVHDKGLLHRDLKPGNIFIARGPCGEPMPKVLDFGICTLTSLDFTLTPDGDVIGTSYYLSPEQARGVEEVDARSDQYSLGVILYEMLTGARPFDGPNMAAVLYAIMKAPLKPPHHFVPDLPAGVEEAVLRALSRDGSRRFESVFELGLGLLPYASERTRVLWAPVFERIGAGTRKVSSARVSALAAASVREETHGKVAPKGGAEVGVTRNPLVAPRLPPKARVDLHGIETLRFAAVPVQDQMTAKVGGVHVFSADQPDTLARAKDRISRAVRLLMICSAEGSEPETQPPLAEVLQKVQDQVEAILLVDQPEVLPGLAKKLCAELAPGWASAGESYLFYERGVCINALRKDRAEPANDVLNVSRFVKMRLENSRRSSTRRPRTP